MVLGFCVVSATPRARALETPITRLGHAECPGNRLAVKPDEIDDPHSGGNLDQPLPQTRQEVIHLTRLRVGVRLGDLPIEKECSFPWYRERIWYESTPSWMAIDVNPTPPQPCYQSGSGRMEKGLRLFDVTPYHS